MLGDCTGEILTLELFLGTALANKSKSQFWLQSTLVVCYYGKMDLLANIWVRSSVASNLR